MILIVEDNPVNAEMVRLSLEREQYETILAHDGEEAMALLEANPGVDLIITDVMMPNVGGLEMVERVRQRPEWKTLPEGVSLAGVRGFDDKGRPKEWPMRLSVAHWAALITDAAPGQYEVRCRTIDANGYAQPMPRPFPKSGRNNIQSVAIEVIAS